MTIERWFPAQEARLGRPLTDREFAAAIVARFTTPGGKRNVIRAMRAALDSVENSN